MALANEARYVMRTLQAHLTLFCLSLPLGACALIGIDPDEIDVFDDAADEAGDTEGETANDAGGSEGETGTEGTGSDTADTAASSDSTGSDPTTSDTSTDGGTTDEGTTGAGSCEPAEQDTPCLTCLKDACCDVYDACLLDANCACNLGCLEGGMCECDPPGDAYALLGECIATNCSDLGC